MEQGEDCDNARTAPVIAVCQTMGDGAKLFTTFFGSKLLPPFDAEKSEMMTGITAFVADK